jgi:hypothetical protein
MNMPDFSFVLITLITFPLMALLTLELIHRRDQRSRLHRQQLRDRFTYVQLPLVLRKLNIDSVHYFATVPLKRIENAVGQCERCDSKDLCGYTLSKARLDREDMEFCPVLEDVAGL